MEQRVFVAISVVLLLGLKQRMCSLKCFAFKSIWNMKRGKFNNLKFIAPIVNCLKNSQKKNSNLIEFRRKTRKNCETKRRAEGDGVSFHRNPLLDDMMSNFIKIVSFFLPHDQILCTDYTPNETETDV